MLNKVPDAHEPKDIDSVQLGVAKLLSVENNSVSLVAMLMAASSTRGRLACRPGNILPIAMTIRILAVMWYD